MGGIDTSDFDRKIIYFDNLIKSGSISIVRYELKKISKKEIPRSHYGAIANIARRVQMPYFVLKLLSGIIRPEKINFEPANDYEKAMYATALSRIGSFKEADEIYQSLDFSKNSQFLLFRALFFMEQWDYSRAIWPLRLFLRNSDLDEYSQKLGYLNLAASLNAAGFEGEAQRLLLERIPHFEQSALLYGNFLELLGQTYFFQKNFSEAKKWLNQALDRFKKMSSHFEIFARKWMLLTEIEESGNQSKGIDNLIAFRNEAQIYHFYEIVRDCDFYQALYQRNDNLFLKVYFGTRFKNHKKKLLRLYQFSGTLPTKYLWKASSLNLSLSNPLPVLKLSEGHWTPQVHFNLKGLPHALLKYLCSDFYRPFHFGEISSHIYQNEYFNPFSTPLKLNQLFSRLRRHFQELNIPLEIRVQNNQVSLVATNSIIFEVSRHKNKKQFASIDLQKLVTIFTDKPFTCKEASIQLNKSVGVTRDVLKLLLETRRIRITKKGPKTSYKIVKE